MASPKSKHKIDIVPLLPPRAPCFPDTAAWQSYIDQAQRTPNRSHSQDLSPARWVKGAVRLDPSWDMCQDCRRRRAEKARMAAVGTCQPDWWQAQAIATNVDLDREAAEAGA